MKKLLLLPLVAGAMIFASCSEDETIFEQPSVDQPIDGVTRAMFAEDDGSKPLNGASQVNAKNLIKKVPKEYINEMSDTLGRANITPEQYAEIQAFAQELTAGLTTNKAKYDACFKWREKHNIHFSLYGTPLESTTYKFAKCLQKRFGLVPGITDKTYITNSYHVHVSEEIDAFTKLRFESEFQQLSPGGAISYVEVPNMQQNIDAVLELMKYIYDNIMYAELNTKSDYCQECGYDGEIRIQEDEDGKLVWVCPNCGNTDQSKMNVARRTCGYIGTQYWNQGRTQEIKDRVLHL